MVTRAYMDFHGYLENQDFQISRNIQDFLEIDEYSWISMDIHGYPWISMDFYEYPWISTNIQNIMDFLWKQKKPTNTNILMPFSLSLNVMREYTFTDY